MLGFWGSRASAPIFNVANASVSTLHVAPPSVDLKTPPVTAPAYMMLGFCGLITSDRVRAPMFPGPSDVHLLSMTAAGALRDSAACSTSDVFGRLKTCCSPAVYNSCGTSPTPLGARRMRYHSYASFWRRATLSSSATGRDGLAAGAAGAMNASRRARVHPLKTQAVMKRTSKERENAAMSPTLSAENRNTCASGGQSGGGNEPTVMERRLGLAFRRCRRHGSFCGRCGRRGGIGGALFMQLPSDVGPKFLEDLRKSVDADLCEQFACRRSCLALLEVIAFRNRHARGVADPLGVVEIELAVVVVRHEDARHCVPGALAHTALRHAEIAGVLMQHDRHDSFGEHVAEHLIAVIGGVAFCEALHSASVRRIGAVDLVDCGEHASQKIQRKIERILHRDIHLLLVRQRNIFRVRIRRAIVRQHAGHALVRGLVQIRILVLRFRDRNVRQFRRRIIRRWRRSLSQKARSEAQENERLDHSVIQSYHGRSNLTARG